MNHPHHAPFQVGACKAHGSDREIGWNCRRKLRTPENSVITLQHLLTMAHGLPRDEAKPWNDPANYASKGASLMGEKRSAGLRLNSALHVGADAR